MTHHIIDLTEFEKIVELLNQKPFTFKTKTIKGKKKIKYQYYNQIATCIIRIRETVNYINSKELKYENACGQAFDFYELVNCISIVEGCVESIFSIFNVNFKEHSIAKNVVFKLSNKTRLNDLNFFKFIRSASSVHPSKTTSYRGKTKRLNEVFPYAIWIKKGIYFDDERPSDCDLELWSWSSRTSSRTNHYCIKTSEFYVFTQFVVDKIEELLPIIKSIRNDYVKKICFKRIKKPKDFNNYSDYLLYLYNRLKKFNGSDDFYDAGIVIASGIMDNNLISDEFKEYIKSQIPKITETIRSNPENICEVDIFEDLSVYECFSKINKEKASYVNEKYWDYLYREAKREIIRAKKQIIKEWENTSGNDAYYVYTLLSSSMMELFKNDELEIAKSYDDLFELTLQAVYYYWKDSNKRFTC